VRSRLYYILRGCRGNYRRTLLTAIGVPFVMLVFLVGVAFAAGIPAGEDLSKKEVARTASSTADPTEKQSTKRAQRKPPRGSCSNPLVIVDRQHGLPQDFVPQNLVPLSAHGVPVLGGDKFFKEEAARHLTRVVEDAKADGMEIVVVSAYRSYSDQQGSYVRWSSLHGPGAGRVSAPPGYSERQLGTTVDLTNAAAVYELTQRFGWTEAARWLKQNVWRYGFALSYPRNRMEETGYLWEPWHFRYIGEENAREWHESGLVFHEFLQREGMRPGC
jgi:D-alanyl-D-alanine carboxypeptidase